MSAFTPRQWFMPLGSPYVADPDFYVWFSTEGKLEGQALQLSKVTRALRNLFLEPEVSGELVFIAGANKTGPYTAALGAAGVTLNLIRGQKKPAGYLGGFYGTEVVTQNTWSGETLPTRPTPDLLLEAGIPLPEAEEEQAAESTGTMSFMPSLVVGAYRTGGETAEETGLYFGLRQEQLPWAVGFGVNLDALQRVGGFAGYLLAPPLLLNHVICMAYDPNYPCQ